MTVLRFHCAICGLRLEVAPERAGGTIECPACERIVPVPSVWTRPHADAGCLPVLPPDILAMEIKFHCNICRARLQIDARAEGSLITCPRCRAETRVPEWSLTTAAVVPPVVKLCADEIGYLSATDDPPIRAMPSP
jgi:DNA-directed RNA polymerase subunit RPC12/RpoP